MGLQQCFWPWLYFAAPRMLRKRRLLPATGDKIGKVYVTGENPVIRLLDKEGGTPLTFASYWRILWSPVGPGHVCYVTTGDGKSPTDVRVALTDNQKLYDYLTREIMVVLDPAIPSRPYSVALATFRDPGQGTFNSSGAMQERTIQMKSGKYNVAPRGATSTNPSSWTRPWAARPIRLALRRYSFRRKARMWSLTARRPRGMSIRRCAVPRKAAAHSWHSRRAG